MVDYITKQIGISIRILEQTTIKIDGVETPAFMLEYFYERDGKAEKGTTIRLAKGDLFTFDRTFRIDIK